MHYKHVFVYTMLTILFTSCASKKITNIQYLSPSETQADPRVTLNVFQPKKPIDAKFPVVIFVHGGYWNAGDKKIYGFLGRNFAKNEVLTVIPNYTLSPKGDYDKMANDIAKVIQWTINNIEDYHGNPNQIYLMGHSAGGHLIALVSTNPKYLTNKDAIKGVILNDAAGLDMFSYLNTHPPTDYKNYTETWTTNPDNWKDASPIYFLDTKSPPFIIYVGTKTYPSIITQNEAFLNALHNYQPEVKSIILNKKHVPMMRQFFFPWSNRYDEILEFMGVE